jgi:hypothetical protein
MTVRSRRIAVTLFESNPIDPSELKKANRLAKSAAGTWLAGWVGPIVLVALTSSGGGEMAMLGFLFMAAVGIASTIISVRLAWRALGLDPGSLLAKLTIGLNLLSALYVLGVVGFIVIIQILR